MIIMGVEDNKKERGWMIIEGENYDNQERRL